MINGVLIKRNATVVTFQEANRREAAIVALKLLEQHGDGHVYMADTRNPGVWAEEMPRWMLEEDAGKKVRP